MNSSTLKIQTPEGITFSYSLAGPVVRALAWIVDFMAIMVGLNIISIASRIGGLINVDIGFAVMALGYFVISIGYAVVMEWAWRGQTLGKRILHLRVMDAQGLRLQFHQVLLRNLLRFVDMLPGVYLLGGVMCCLTRRCQRLGDLAASTVVVHNIKPLEPDLDQLLAGKFNSLRQYPHLEARLRQHVSPDEARLALQALVRRDELEPAARVALFSELADHFKTLVAFPPEIIDAMPDEQYIRNVVDILFRQRGADRNADVREAVQRAQELASGAVTGRTHEEVMQAARDQISLRK